ncbi:MAG: 4-(cytidine 5'-diphospho)-2-C-methyl-D-erythritol kinase, partial [Marinilabiliales bacterium]
TDKRADGFHNLESLFYPVLLKDILEIVPNGRKEDRLFITGKAIEGKQDQNLCMKALKRFRQEVEMPGTDIHLHKLIPMGAGLGGGSSDASFTLKLLNDLFDAKLSEKSLIRIAEDLGSDCPFFIINKPAIVSGRGEFIKVVDFTLAGDYIVLVHPHIHISTAEAFAGIKPREASMDIEKICMLPKSEWKKHVFNDFEKNLKQKHKEIQKIKQELYDKGAYFASLTGSGSSVFGLFDHKPELTGVLNFETNVLNLS